MKFLLEFSLSDTNLHVGIYNLELNNKPLSVSKSAHALDKHTAARVYDWCQQVLWEEYELHLVTMKTTTIKLGPTLQLVRLDA